MSRRVIVINNWESVFIFSSLPRLYIKFPVFEPHNSNIVKHLSRLKKPITLKGFQISRCIIN